MSDTPETDMQVFKAARFGAHVVPADFVRKLERQRDRLAEALGESAIALKDWGNTLPDGNFDPHEVAVTHMRIKNNGGTLAYIAGVQKLNYDALAEINKEKS